jgi:hypothetical protein
MRIRFIAFLLPAALVTVLILLTSSVITSKLVSNLEQRMTGGQVSATVAKVRYETECESFARRIEAVARDAQSCEALPGCLRSQNICPVELQQQLAHEYDVLRRVASERCSELPTYVTRVAASCVVIPEDCSLGQCRAASGTSPPPGSSGTSDTSDLSDPTDPSSARTMPETFLF